MDEKNEIYSGIIRAEFALEAEDVKAALQLSGRYKSHVGLHIFQSVLALLGMAVFISSIVANPTNLVNYFLTVVCLLLLGLIWIYPAIVEKRAIEKTVDGRKIRVELEPNRIHICIPENETNDSFSLEELAAVKKNESIFLLELPGGSMLVIPLRALPAGSIAAADEILQKAGRPDIISEPEEKQADDSEK